MEEEEEETCVLEEEEEETCVLEEEEEETWFNTWVLLGIEHEAIIPSFNV